MTIKSELDRQRLSYMAFRYDAGTGMFQGYDGSSWKYLDKLRYNSGTSLFEGWNGSAWGSIGGGLTITPINHTFAGTLENGKHYLLDMSAATGDVTLTLVAGSTGANVKVMVYGNLASNYRLILQGNGAETISFNGVSSNTLRLTSSNTWLELGWTAATWLAEHAGDTTDSLIMSKALTELDANTDSTFTYYTRSDFDFDKKTFFGSTTGTDSILTLGKVVLNSTQQFISSSLQGSMMIADAPIVNAAQAKLLYKTLDASPTVSISRDGGNSWVAAWQQSVSGKAVIADVLFPSSSSPLFDAGTPNGTQTAAFYIAEIFQPTYRTAFTAFGAYVKLASSSSVGTVVGKLMAVVGGVPTTTIATSRETLVVGQDITTTSAYKVFSFANVTLDPATQYALVLYSTGMAVNLSADQVTSSPSYILGSATSTNGSSWSGSGSTDLAFQIYGTGIDVQLKVVSGTASSELAGFGVEMVLDTPTTYAGDASFETRVITATEATTGTITLTSVRFTPGTHQLHCNYSGHDFVAPTFTEIGGGVVQFPVNFFSAGDTANFYVTYGLTNLSNVPVTINNMVSSNSTLGSVTIPAGFTLDKPYMDIPAGATVSGAGNIETTGYVSGDGVLATSGEVLSTGLAPTQPKFDKIEEATAGKGVAIQGRTDGAVVASGYVGEVLTASGSNVTTSTSTDTAVATRTLTTGTWLVAVQSISDNIATQTGADHRFYIKGIITNTLGKDVAYMSTTAAGGTCVTFCQVVVVASGDANKDVMVSQQSRTVAGRGCAYITATRIA